MIATTSTVVLVALIVIGLVNAPGWPRVQQTFFDASYGWQVLPQIAQGLWLNVRLMVVCEIGILILAMIVALVRRPVFFPLRAAATIYADLFPACR